MVRCALIGLAFAVAAGAAAAQTPAAQCAEAVMAPRAKKAVAAALGKKP
jgi:hypothetical protein